MDTLRCQCVKGSDGSAREDFGQRACSSNNHQLSIILHQFSRDYAGTYYYHFDALGSVVALTDADADDVQKYDYSVWGQVGAWDVVITR